MSKELLTSTYKGKKVLITGHTGFKGSWLTLWLLELGSEVIGYSLKPPTKPSLFEVLGIDKKIIHINGDVRNKSKLSSISGELKPEFIFHMAAQTLVRFSYKEPKLTYETNVMGTVNVLEAMRRTNSVKACIIVTSDKCYENKEWIYYYREIDPLGGSDPYSSSKACAELVVDAYRKSFFNQGEHEKAQNVALSSVRAGNVIGGGDWGKDRLIPDCMRALPYNKTIIIRNPQAIRPWQYVLDPLGGYLLLGALMYKDGPKYSGAWNFGPNDENMLTVEELLKLIIKHWGNGEYTVSTSPQPPESRLLSLDSRKARTSLGWKSLYSIYEAVERTINWYKNFYDRRTKKEELYEFITKEVWEYLDRVLV